MRKSSKLKVMLYLSVLTIVALVWCNLGSHANAADPIEIKVASSQPGSHYLVNYVFKPWCKEVEKRTNGAVKFTWFPAGSLISFKQNAEAIKKGMAEMTDCVGLFWHESKYPVTSLLHLPFLFTSTAQADQVYQEAYNTIPELRKETEGLKFLGFHLADLNNFHWVRGVKAARTIDDLRGRRIIVAGGTAADLVKILGMTPRTVKTADRFMTLQRKMVDGIMVPTGPLAKWKYDQVTDAHSLVYIKTVTIAGVMNQKFFDSLPANVKKVINDLIPSWTRFAGAIVDNRRLATIRGLKKRGDEIYEFTGEQREKLRDMAKPLYDNWFEKMRDKGIDPQPIFDKVMALIKKYEGVKYPDDSWWAKDWKR